MPAPRVSHLLETALYVADLDRSEKFYQRLMGFETFLRDDRMVGMGVPGGSVLLLFRHGGSVHPSHTPTGTIPPHDAHGHQHLAFAIPLGELEAWEGHLQAEQIELESRVTWPRGGVSLYFRDPDQHSVEVAIPGLWPTW
jgi:catechol 2,3-dioxygenase-like lactoylglutathione lyase family enzyme